MTEDQQWEFTSVQILLKRRNADVPKLPFLDDIRSWKDIGVSAFEYLPPSPPKKTMLQLILFDFYRSI